jgi:hypothetical protein
MTAVSTFRRELEAAVLERHCAHYPMTQKWARESAKMRWFYFDGIYLHYDLGYKLR